MPLEFDVQVCLMLALGLGYVCLLWVVDIVLCRQWVKKGLHEHGLKPLQIRWRPFSSGNMCCRFNVVYSDTLGEVHRERCWTYWHRPGVHPEPEDLAENL